MCGIFGFYRKKKSPYKLEQALANLKHRGPDESHLFQEIMQEGFFGGGVTRLSVVNSEKKLRPKSNNLIVLFNGEIWNYVALAKKWGIAKADEIQVIEFLYEKRGDQFVEELDGIFSIAIVDKAQQKLVLARDPVGVKPLFFYYTSRGICFASDIKTLDKIWLKKKKQLNYNYFLNQYIFGFSDYKNAFLSGVKELAPSSIMVYGFLTKKARIKSYRLSVFSKSSFIDDEHTFEKAIQQALLKQYNQCDFYPIALLLSGGIDSSLLTVMAWKLGLKGFRCFFVGSRCGHDYKWAKRISEITGYPLEVIELVPEQIAPLIPEICYFKPGAFGGVHIYMAFKEIKKRYPKIKVAWCGEGADEMFGGYIDHINAEKILNQFEKKRILAGQKHSWKGIKDWKKNPPAYLYDFYQQEQLTLNHLIPFDHCSMAHSIELRVPFLDLCIFGRISKKKILRQIQVKNQKQWLKALLRKYSGIQEKDFYDRKKMGFPSVVAFYGPDVEKLIVPQYPLSPEVQDCWLLRKPIDKIFVEICRKYYLDKKLTDFSCLFDQKAEALYSNLSIHRMQTLVRICFPFFYLSQKKWVNECIRNFSIQERNTPMSILISCMEKFSKNRFIKELLEFEFMLTCLSKFPGFFPRKFQKNLHHLPEGVFVQHFHYDFFEPVLHYYKTQEVLDIKKEEKWVIFNLRARNKRNQIMEISKSFYDNLFQTTNFMVSRQSKWIEKLRALELVH